MNRILVLMSTYNGASFIREQITTVINQRKVDVFLLIRDDGSTDLTIDVIAEICKEHNNIKLIKGDNKGCAQSFLSLMEAAQTMEEDFDYIAFSDQDDYWQEEKLFRAVEKLNAKSASEPLVYFSNLYVVDEHLGNKQLMYGDLHPYLNKPHLMVENFATGCTMVFNKSTLNSFLAHPINNLRVHDIRLFHMCLFLGDYVYDDNAYILYRQHGDNVIGANFYREQRWKSKCRSMKNLWQQHVREDEAREVLSAYGDEMSEEDKQIVKIVAQFRNKIKYRLLLLFAPGRYKFRLRRKVDTFWFKVRVILGVV